MDVIATLNYHNHQLEDYKADTYQLKSCRTHAKHSQQILGKSSMLLRELTHVHTNFRSTNAYQPCILPGENCGKKKLNESKFCEMLHKTTFCSDNGVVFYWNEMFLLAELTNIQFDGTFFPVATQMSQLWSVFVAVGRDTLSTMYCLTTLKSEEIYSGIIHYNRQHHSV